MRCWMHAFSLIVGSVLGHPYSKDIIAKASDIVSYIRSSHLPLQRLRTAAHEAHIQQELQRANTTRFTSVFNCLNSLKKLQIPLTSIELADRRLPTAEKVFSNKGEGVQ